MWGYTNNSNPDLLELHLKLANKLAYLSWKRVQIWNSSTSVHEWSVGKSAFAFDVTLSKGAITLTLVARDKSLAAELKRGLVLESIKFKQDMKRLERFSLGTFQVLDKSDHEGQIADMIKKVRRSVDLTLHESFQYLDKISGLTINYSVKSERKSNQRLIIIFTSIRSKQHWIDFDGPLGRTLQSNRARIVFINDDAASEYCYHMALNGNTSVNDATLRFINDYVGENGYSWDNVTLAGMSKGGTAALVLGCQLPSCDVVALAPQLRLGEYLLDSKRDAIISTLTGKQLNEGAFAVDNIMWDLIEGKQSKIDIGYCYVLTSLKDTHCVEGLDRLRELFTDRNKGNLEVHVDDSNFTTNHIETVLHLMPLFVSLLGIISSGIKPALSTVLISE
ncbi:hypothetical protein AOZ07_07335 [Glutamicibacter halophytocola]|uniref:alpha/beta hydrolase n=1 Tax=Glutamicibacter halophytocola TaxID=1933880 RepID=UPI0006D4A7CA|nr:alpha/beta hydrolase [Glutamicibacter halophytocola]ALG28817.1 hypothetical protein AOZ07_07335 [Glutamicibacter halophytocola]